VAITALQVALREDGLLPEEETAPLPVLPEGEPPAPKAAALS